MAEVSAILVSVRLRLDIMLFGGGGGIFRLKEAFTLIERLCFSDFM